MPKPLTNASYDGVANSNPEQSFLAIRYLRRIIIRPGALNVLPFDVASDILSGIANLVYSLPHIVEWDYIDDIFMIAIKFCLTHIEERGEFSNDCISKWNKVLISTFTLVLN